MLSHRPTAALAPELGRSFRIVALDWGATLLDLMAPLTLNQGHLEPVTRASGAGERGLAQPRAEPIQYTAGSSPPEPATSR